MDLNEEPDVSVEDKKRRVFERLNARHQQRNTQSQVTSGEGLFEPTELDELRSQAKLTLADPNAAVDPILLQRIESALSLISGGFEARCFRDLHDQLVARLQQNKKPESTFQFASKVNAEKPVDKNLNEEKPLPVSGDAPTIIHRSKESKIISDLKNEQVNIEGTDGEEITIMNVVDSNIRASFSASTIHLKNIQNSLVIFAPVSSSVLIRSCSGVTVVAAAQQIRIHDSHHLQLYIAVRGAVIIEDCDDIKVAPYQVRNIKLDWMNDNWKDVKDFDWLSTDQNPHWSVMGEELWKTFDLN